MLKNLFVKNFALLDKIEIEFEPGLNIITGETGAGKSILIDALGSTLGEKVDGDVLRSGTDKAIVEGVFSIDGVKEVKNSLTESELEDTSDTIILRKEVHQSGRNRAFINDTPVPVTKLISFGDLLVDLHGQHEHQSLLKVKYHLLYLDEFGGFAELVEHVQKAFQKLVGLINDLKDLKLREESLTEKREIYQFQIKEIAAINPQVGEEQELLQEEKILRNSEKLFQISNEVYMKLYESEGSALELITATYDKLDELCRIDSQFDAYKKDCLSAKIIVEEISQFLQSYKTNIEFSPERLETIRERLAQFSGLKKKYGSTIEEILKYKQKIEQELSLIDNLDEEVSRKQEAIDAEKRILADLCVNLSQEREKAANILENTVEEALAHLGMAAAKFKIQIDQIENDDGLVTVNNKGYKTASTGIDNVEFFISANTGEELKPLAKVASGGEISRIMLALKTALAEADKIPVLIFDEIDMGISGRIAQAVGKSLKKLARSHQIICITHLPQIASMGDQHFVVEKFSDGKSTHTKIRRLKTEQRALEIAKLLGGETVTETHIHGAQELLEQAEKL